MKKMISIATLLAAGSVIAVTQANQSSHQVKRIDSDSVPVGTLIYSMAQPQQFCSY